MFIVIMKLCVALSVLQLDLPAIDSKHSINQQRKLGNYSSYSEAFSPEPNPLYMDTMSSKTFTQHHNYPSSTAVCRITEGDEPSEFKTVFCWWKDRAVKERQLARSYTVANIGKCQEALKIKKIRFASKKKNIYIYIL